MPPNRPQGWAAAIAGASAGVAVVAFAAMPWPAGLIAVPVLAGWAVVLSAATSPYGWRRPQRILVIAGATAIVLGGLLLTVL
jgi:hypothetical protein